jgi:hypothetical protein
VIPADDQGLPVPIAPSPFEEGGITVDYQSPVVALRQARPSFNSLTEKKTDKKKI